MPDRQSSWGVCWFRGICDLHDNKIDTHEGPQDCDMCLQTELPQGCGAYVLVLPDMLLKTQRGNKASKEDD